MPPLLSPAVELLDVAEPACGGGPVPVSNGTGGTVLYSISHDEMIVHSCTRICLAFSLIIILGFWWSSLDALKEQLSKKD
jgi:hypothetical protein